MTVQTARQRLKKGRSLHCRAREERKGMGLVRREKETIFLGAMRRSSLKKSLFRGPTGLKVFYILSHEPNIFTGTHVMEEYHLGGKPTKGPTLDTVADYIADLVRKRQGSDMEAHDDCAAHSAGEASEYQREISTAKWDDRADKGKKGMGEVIEKEKEK